MRIIKQFGKKYVSSFLLLIGLVVITYYFVFRKCDIDSLIAVVASARLDDLFIGIGLVFVYIGCEGVCIRMIAKSLQLTIGRVRCFCYACIDVYYCGITPSATGGQPVLMYYMSKENVPISKSAILLLLYTVQYKIVLLFLGMIVYIFHRDFILSNGRGVIVLFVIGIIINIISISICLLCMYSKVVIRKIVMGMIDLLSKIHIIKNKEKKVQSFCLHLEEYHESAVFIRENKKVLIKVFFITLIQRVAMFSVGYMVYRGLGLKDYRVFDILALQVVIAITVDSLPLPGAVGISEAMFFLLYRIVYSPELMAPAMLLSRGIAFYFCLIVCGIISILYHMITAKQREVLEGE